MNDIKISKNLFRLEENNIGIFYDSDLNEGFIINNKINKILTLEDLKILNRLSKQLFKHIKTDE
jgi:hypothetical protein